MKKILITGSAGFVGQALVARFHQMGYSVIAIDVNKHEVPQGVQMIQLDITDKDQVIELFKNQNINSIIHNASIVHTKQSQEKIIWKVNYEGSSHILESAQLSKTVQKIVYISTASAVYEGKDIENGNEELSYSSISQAPYADAKIAAEKKLLADNGKNNIAICAIRPHIIFGPNDSRFLPTILEKAQKNKLKYGVGKGDKLSDFTYIDNLIDAIELVEKKLSIDDITAGKPYFVTNGEPMEFFSFVNLFLQELGYPQVKKRIPYKLAYFVASIKEAWDTFVKGGTLNSESGFSRFTIRYLCTHHYFSINQAKKDFGYSPSISLTEGVKKTVQALKKLKK